MSLIKKRQRIALLIVLAPLPNIFQAGEGA